MTGDDLVVDAKIERSLRSGPDCVTRDRRGLQRRLNAAARAGENLAASAGRSGDIRDRRGGATLGPARAGRRGPAFVVVRASRGRLHAPCLARNSGICRRRPSTTAQPELSTVERRSSCAAGSSASHIGCPQFRRSNPGYTNAAIDRDRPAFTKAEGSSIRGCPNLVIATKRTTARTAS